MIDLVERYGAAGVLVLLPPHAVRSTTALQANQPGRGISPEVVLQLHLSDSTFCAPCRQGPFGV